MRGGPTSSARPDAVTLQQLRVFVAVAEREHITRAAVDLRLAQSVVSSRICALESAIGSRLFDRSGRNIRLSAIGRDLWPKASRVLDLVDDLCALPAPRRHDEA